MGEHKDNLNRFEQACCTKRASFGMNWTKQRIRYKHFFAERRKDSFTREDRIKALFSGALMRHLVETYQNQIIYEFVMENALQDENYGDSCILGFIRKSCWPVV